MHLDLPERFQRPPALAAQAWRDPLALLLASIGEGIYGVDLDGRCDFINPAGAEMIGYQPEQLIGLNMHDITHHTQEDGSPYPEQACPIFNAFRQGLPCRIDSEHFWRRDGSSFPVEYSSHPIPSWTVGRCAVRWSPLWTSPNAGAPPTLCSTPSRNSKRAWPSASRR